MAWSPDGEWLASASEDQTVIIWDGASGQVVTTLKGHTHRVYSVAWSPDGEWLASASYDQTVIIWDVASGEAVTTLKGHTAGVYSVAWSPDGQRLASASADRTLLLLKTRFVCELVSRNLTFTEWEQYLPATRPYQATCANHSLTPQSLLAVGQAQARAGDIEGAMAQFQKALKLDPSLELDPEKEIASLVEGGEILAREGQIEDAIAAYEQAQTLAPALLEISDAAWNSLCRFGSLWGFATQVLDACEEAVALAPEDGNVRDSRGLARALTEDTAGAIEDFKFAVEWWRKNEYGDELISSREAWIAALEAGQNPFDTATLEALKSK